MTLWLIYWKLEQLECFASQNKTYTCFWTKGLGKNHIPKNCKINPKNAKAPILQTDVKILKKKKKKKSLS